jgi:hypothetical protein
MAGILGGGTWWEVLRSFRGCPGRKLWHPGFFSFFHEENGFPPPRVPVMIYCPAQGLLDHD